jgi:hypothetical protein
MIIKEHWPKGHYCFKIPNDSDSRLCRHNNIVHAFYSTVILQVHSLAGSKFYGSQKSPNVMTLWYTYDHSRRYSIVHTGILGRKQ